MASAREKSAPPRVAEWKMVGNETPGPPILTPADGLWTCEQRDAVFATASDDFDLMAIIERARHRKQSSSE